MVVQAVVAAVVDGVVAVVAVVYLVLVAILLAVVTVLEAAADAVDVAVVQAHVATVVWENVLLYAQVTVLDNALALLSKRDSICSVTAARATLWFLYRG